MAFKWHPDEPPPPIEPHSKAKLDVLRQYLRAYLDRLTLNYQRDEFKLDFVDGFSGGGVFRDEDEILSGTPLIMLEESNKAMDRLKRTRTKPLHFDHKFYFVDKEKAHTDHLRKTLIERGHQVGNDNIVIRNGRFEDEVDGIIEEIARRQPRAGRAIFLLDQTGYSQVRLALVARIFNELPAAEVILTYAADGLINYIERTRPWTKSGAYSEFTDSQIRDLIQPRDQRGGRALAQRVLRENIRDVLREHIRIGTIFDTPFFIRPKISRRDLWFLHLSRHPIARDVMIQIHWNIHNTFIHYGPGGFGMMGVDAIKNPEEISLFQFGKIESNRVKEELLNSMPRQIHSLASENPVTVDAIRHALANETTARFSDLDEVFIDLAGEREIGIWSSDGNIRSRSRNLRRLKSTDRIAFPDTRLFPQLSRLGQEKK